MCYKRLILILFCLMAVLSSCSTGTPELSGLSPQAQAEIIKNYGGVYKVGNPYKIAGKWYYPKEDYSYSEIGVASWYGEDFNGKPTANGERYNMNTLTAAHRTLPLPSIVKVTNLQNGKSLILRVNDRGPYVKDRIIDLSKRGAQLLGYLGQGTTRVKVEVLAQESKALKAALLNHPLPGGTALAANSVPAHSLYESSAERIKISEQAEIYASAGGRQYSYGTYDAAAAGAYQPAVYGSAASVSGEVRSGSLGRISESDVAPAEDLEIYGTAAANPNKKNTQETGDSSYQYMSGYYYVHAGAFSEYERAKHLMERLKEYGSSHIVPVTVNGVAYHRVSVGPYSRAEEATVAQAKLKYYGVKDARIEKK